MLRLHIKPEFPQPRHIARAVELLRSGGLMIYPTDTTYGLGCDVFAKRSVDRLYQVKGLDAKHPLAFLCADLAEAARYAVVEDRNYRILRHHIPGAFTFILPATREVPKMLQSKVRTVGIRISKSAVCAAVLRELGHPIVTTTVSTPNYATDAYTNDPDDIARDFGRSVEVFLDAGPLYGEPSSVVDLTGDVPRVIRRGSGDLSWLESD
jgi:tRNA threonylcarbamoyl adenosine modification protein (Sua5/YciO/YrdC/YwlC family)